MPPGLRSSNDILRLFWLHFHPYMQGLLEAHESVAGHTLSDLPGAINNPTAADLCILLLIDTAGCDFEEQQEEDGDSKYNQGEAAAALAHVQRLLAAGLSPADIGIITPYSAQVLPAAALRLCSTTLI